MDIRYLSIMIAVLLPSLVAADGYPTLERVDHVLTCMRTNGGQTVDNLYSCSCEIDIIAQQLTFDDFNEARTFEIYKRMPGEKGSLFRDNDRAKTVVGKLDAARGDAKKRCFIGRRAKLSKDLPGASADGPKALVEKVPTPAAVTGANAVTPPK